MIVEILSVANLIITIYVKLSLHLAYLGQKYIIKLKLKQR